MIFGAFLAIYLWRIRQIRQQLNLKADYEKKLSELKLQALSSQMNPHFIYNAINSINWFIIKNDRDNASDYLTKFSRLMRLNLENSKSDLISLASEIEAVKLYLEMEQLRFEKTFTYSLNIQSHINTESIKVPPMILQPYLENAIWHGLMHRNESGHIRIDIYLTDGLLRITMEDNGIGREASKNINAQKRIKKRSLGMQITQDRLEQLSRHYNMNANIEIQDLYDEQGMATGTKVLINLPYQKNQPKS